MSAPSQASIDALRAETTRIYPQSHKTYPGYEAIQHYCELVMAFIETLEDSQPRPEATREDLARAWEVGRKSGWDDACRSWGDDGPEPDDDYASNPYRA